MIVQAGGRRGGNREVVNKEISVRIIVACGHDITPFLMRTLPCVLLAVEGLPVHVIVGTPIVAIPLVVIRTFVMDGAIPPTILVSVRHSAVRPVIALGVGVGAVFVGVVLRTAPKTVLQSRALEVLVVRVKLLAFAAADGVRKGAAVGTIACAGFVVELGHVDNTYVVL